MTSHLKEIATRTVNAEETFIARVQESFGVTKAEAEKVFTVFKKVKAIKLDRWNGVYNLTHGAYWEKKVIKNAIAF